MSATIVRRRRLPRRRDGLHQPETIRAERDRLAHYVDHAAKSQRLQLMAFGAKQALDWALDNRDDMRPSRLLDLTEFALQMQRRKPMRLVPSVRDKKMR